MGYDKFTKAILLPEITVVGSFMIVTCAWYHPQAGAVFLPIRDSEDCSAGLMSDFDYHYLDFQAGGRQVGARRITVQSRMLSFGDAFFVEELSAGVFCHKLARVCS